MRLGRQPVVQGCHRSGQQLLHGCNDLCGRGDFLQLGGLLLQANLNLGEAPRIGSFAGLNASFQIRQGAL
jgi:hypothetical protein